ncbi:hypothetical protein GCM10027447_00260 [Glycomyces halotolerans]
MNDDAGRVRISNAERERAIEQLREALEEGRIELSEFDERSKATYEAKTNAELDLVFQDLPVSRAHDSSVHTIDLTPEERAEREAAVRERVEGGGSRLSGMTQALIWVSCTTLPIWLFVLLITGETQGFWPFWAIISLGAITLAQKLTSRGDDE